MLIPQCNRLMHYSNSNNTCFVASSPDGFFPSFSYCFFFQCGFFFSFCVEFFFYSCCFTDFLSVFFCGYLFFLLLHFSFSCVFLHYSNFSFMIFAVVFYSYLDVLRTFFLVFLSCFIASTPDGFFPLFFVLFFFFEYVIGKFEKKFLFVMNCFFNEIEKTLCHRSVRYRKLVSIFTPFL